MKQKILLLFLLGSVLLFNKAKANETEPNDTKAQANVLPLNGNNSGAIGTSTDVDWYKVTTNADGRINLTLTVSNNFYCWFALYDNDGITLLHQDNTSGTLSYSVDGLAVGTYYVKVFPYYGGEMPAYTLSNTLTVPTQANDAEPNNTRATAKVLALNKKTTGHIGYYYNHVRDSSDWYKITTTGDGLLKLTLTSGNNQYVTARLFDNDGITQLGYVESASNNVVNVNTDGLAAGTYYVQIRPYYSDGFEPYTLSDSLFTPVQPNDAEPDSTKALALTLPLNGTVTGHSNYYYNHHRDSADWYKLTTNGDGLIRLTLTSGNNQYVSARLYDNDGTTQLAYVESASNNVVSVGADGLAAGTYYVQIKSYYNDGFEPYTLSDSLFGPAQSNDVEPNNTAATAKALAVNKTTTGHSSYYYNHQRDSADWYKVTIPNDGMVKIFLTSANNQYVTAKLYDNDGTTQLAYVEAVNGINSVNTDGLAAGTYYVKIAPYYNDGFVPYKLTDSLITYNYAADVEPNNYFKQAKTLPANKTTTGHVGFYNNGITDNVDYYKINYTANTGNLTLSFTQENRLKYGSTDYTWFQVFQDTTASPIFSQYYNAPSGDINLTGLAKGYYYIKVFTYYSGIGEHFSSYSITNKFTQIKARIETFAYDSTAACDLNWITYKLSGSHAPYKVQLYRFDKAYSTKSSSAIKVTFDNLPDGIYYATVFGDGATGAAFGISDTITIMPTPMNTKAKIIKGKQVTVAWDSLPCADYFTVRYKAKDSTKWYTVQTMGNVSSYVIQGLAVSTTYQWQVSASDTENNMVAKSALSTLKSFTTKDGSGTGSLIADGDDNASSKTLGNIVMVAPNPANSYFIIRMNTNSKQNMTATLYNAIGKAVWNSGALSADALNGKQVNVSQFGSGLYYLKIVDADGNLIGNTKVSIAR